MALAVTPVALWTDLGTRSNLDDPMEATSTRHAGAAPAHELVPPCPHCGSEMVVRAQWSGGHVNGLYWGCKRAPGCEGTRRIKQPETVRPYAHDASSQAIFDWESSQERRAAARQVAPLPPAPSGGLRGLFGKVLSREPEEMVALSDSEAAGLDGAVGHFDRLTEHGFVIIEQRALPAARAHIDALIVGPSGVFVVESKTWSGQVMTTSDSIFVDGRQRMGAVDDILRAADALGQTLDYELKPLGVSVRPALLFELAANKSFEASVGNVLVGGTRGLPKAIRGRDEPVLGPETIVRLAVAADRLLE
jgi:Nuclease-related domain